MAEWSKAAVLKTAVRATVPGVRIPLHPLGLGRSIDFGVRLEAIEGGSGPLMIQSCVTIRLVSEARGGPFVYWNNLAASCRAAAELGFDAIEIFAPSADSLDPARNTSAE